MDAIAELGVQHHSQIGSQILGGPARDALEVGGLAAPDQPPDRPASSRHIDRTPPRRRARSAGLTTEKMCCALSAAYSNASARGDISPVAGSRTISPDHRSDARVAGLEGPQYLVTRIGQPGAKPVDLGRLADPVTALENDKDPTRCAHAPSFFLVLAQTSTNSRRVWRDFRVSRSKSRPAANACSGSRLATRSYVASSR